MKEEIQKTKENIYCRASDIARDNKQYLGEKREGYITLQQLMEALKVACPCRCEDQEPYGFVPEADCPVHDAPLIKSIQ